MLYVSIWKIALTNLPGTTFTKRLLLDLDAGTLISQARADGTLMGVSSADLIAPYEKRSYDLHVDVCDALRTRGIELSVRDFFNETFCNPLQFARVSQDHRLLVVDCGFRFDHDVGGCAARNPETQADAKGQELARVSKMFKLNPDSFAFHLFEEMSQ